MTDFLRKIKRKLNAKQKTELEKDLMDLFFDKRRFVTAASDIVRSFEYMAVVGSIGQPQSCKDAAQMYENWEILGGLGWDYKLGKPIQNIDGKEYEFDPTNYPV